MNAKNSIDNNIKTLDSAVAIALLAGIGNFALGKAAWAAQQVVREQAQDAEHVENNLERGRPTSDVAADIDDANAPEDFQVAGAEVRETHRERLNRFGKLYANVYSMGLELGADEWSRPQSPQNFIDWQATQPDEVLRRAKAQTDVARAVRDASRAAQDKKFWSTNKPAVTLELLTVTGDLMPDGVGKPNIEIQLDGDGDLTPIEDFLEPVEQVQAMMRGFGAVLDRLNNFKASPYWEGTGPISQDIRSDAGALESALPKLEKFIEDLEMLHRHDIREAVERGQNLLTLDIVRARSEQKLKARLERTLAKAA